MHRGAGWIPVGGDSRALPASFAGIGSDRPASTARMDAEFFLEPFPASTQEVSEGSPLRAESASPEQIIAAIQTAGVVGLGGAGFPTHAKLKIPDGKYVDTLIINGVECEPYLTSDHRVMLEHAADVVAGIPYLMRHRRPAGPSSRSKQTSLMRPRHFAQRYPQRLPSRWKSCR